MTCAPQLGGFPRSHVHEMELSSNDLMGWMSGDVDNIVLTRTPAQIAASRFAEAELHRGF